MIKKNLALLHIVLGLICASGILIADYVGIDINWIIAVYIVLFSLLQAWSLRKN